MFLVLYYAKSNVTKRKLSSHESFLFLYSVRTDMKSISFLFKLLQTVLLLYCILAYISDSFLVKMSVALEMFLTHSCWHKSFQSVLQGVLKKTVKIVPALVKQFSNVSKLAGLFASLHQAHCSRSPAHWMMHPRVACVAILASGLDHACLWWMDQKWDFCYY